MRNSLSRKERKITALHVCYLAPGNQSGYETRVLEETSLLVKSGFEIVIACFVNRNQLFPLGRLWKFYWRLKRTTNAKIHICPTLKFFDIHNSPEGVTEVVSHITKLANRYNAHIIHGQALYSVMHVLRAKNRTKAKVVFDIHGVTPEETEMSGGHPNRIKALENWEKEVLESANLRIFVSKKMKAFFDKKYGFSNLPYVVVPCCVHPENFSMTELTRSARRTELGLDNKFVVLYLGTLSVWQWPKAMFSLFSQIHLKRPDCLFYLLLPRYEHEKAMSLLQQYNLPKSSYRIEEVPHSDVGNYLGVADAGLLLRETSPVNYVSSPTKFGEYLAAGVPVIATTDIGDTSNMIQECRIGLIVNVEDDGGSPEELSKMLSFIEDISLHHEEWATRCRRTAEGSLDWPTHGKLLATIYEQIAFNHD